MSSSIVREIAFLPNGVQGLRIRKDHVDAVLPLERGMEVSFRISGSQVPVARKDPCTMCNGSRCIKGIPDCNAPHIVYLAIFGQIAKVGVTKERRYILRMREQGAPFAARVSVCANGLEARRLERELTSLDGLKGSVRFQDKVNSLGSLGSIREAERVAAGTGLHGRIQVEDLRRLYQNPDLDSSPRPLIIQGDGVRGRVEDTRGEALYLAHRNNLYVYDLRRAIGRRLTPGRTRLKAQLTLPNFGASP